MIKYRGQKFGCWPIDPQSSSKTAQPRGFDYFKRLWKKQRLFPYPTSTSKVGNSARRVSFTLCSDVFVKNLIFLCCPLSGFFILAISIVLGKYTVPFLLRQSSNFNKVTDFIKGFFTSLAIRSQCSLQWVRFLKNKI